MEKNVTVLEKSTNTHKMLIVQKPQVTELGNGIMKINTNGVGIVTHGEHGTLITESKNVIKYIQQEVNPVTRALQNAFD
jgi:hypothetical protein